MQIIRAASAFVCSPLMQDEMTVLPSSWFALFQVKRHHLVGLTGPI